MDGARTARCSCCMPPGKQSPACHSQPLNRQYTYLLSSYYATTMHVYNIVCWCEHQRAGCTYTRAVHTRPIHLLAVDGVQVERDIVLLARVHLRYSTEAAPLARRTAAAPGRTGEGRRGEVMAQRSQPHQPRPPRPAPSYGLRPTACQWGCCPSPSCHCRHVLCATAGR